MEYESVVVLLKHSTKETKKPPAIESERHSGLGLGFSHTSMLACTTFSVRSYPAITSRTKKKSLVDNTALLPHSVFYTPTKPLLLKDSERHYLRNNSTFSFSLWYLEIELRSSRLGGGGSGITEPAKPATELYN